MALVITQIPEYPVSTKPVKITFTPSASVNFVRIWVTDAPVGSALKKRLDDSDSSRIQVFSGDTSSIWEFAADLPGIYVFTAQEYTLNAGNFGGGYADDPDGYKTETQVGSEQSISVKIGKRFTMPIGTGEDRATLVVHVWDDTIRATNFEHHGEKTPSIVDAKTARAITASVNSSVLSALTALEDTSPADDLTTRIADFITNLNAHLGNATAHATATDTTNTIRDGFAAPSGTKSNVTSVQQIIKSLRAHMESNDGTGIGTATWHQISGSDKADLANALIVDGPSDAAGMIGALADGFRAYESHRVSTAVHNAADSTNDLMSLTPLFEVHRAYLAAIRPTSPTVPSTVHSGETILVSTFGMKAG